jgi:hypothetical protein
MVFNPHFSVAIYSQKLSSWQSMVARNFHGLLIYLQYLPNWTSVSVIGVAPNIGFMELGCNGS